MKDTVTIVLVGTVRTRFSLWCRYQSNDTESREWNHIYQHRLPLFMNLHSNSDVSFEWVYDRPVTGPSEESKETSSNPLTRFPSIPQMGLVTRLGIWYSVVDIATLGGASPLISPDGPCMGENRLIQAQMSARWRYKANIANNYVNLLGSDPNLRCHSIRAQSQPFHRFQLTRWWELDDSGTDNWEIWKS